MERNPREALGRIRVALNSSEPMAPVAEGVFFSWRTQILYGQAFDHEVGLFVVNGRHYDPTNQSFVGVGPASASVSNPYLGNPFKTGPGDFSLETNVLRRTFGWNQDEAVQFEKRLPGVRTRLFGGLNAVIGFAGMLTATLAGPLAPAAFLVSFDLFVSGMAQAITGEEQDTAVARGTKAVARELGASPEEAGEIAFAVELGLGFINPTRAAAAGATRAVARSGLRAALGSGLRGVSRAAVELMSRAARSTRQIINAAKSSRVAEALTTAWERTRSILTMCMNKCFVAGTLVTVLAAGVDLDEANAALQEAHAIDAETGDSYATEAALAEYTALKPIEEIATGDYVLSRPEDDPDAPLVFERVEMTSTVPTDSIVEITVRDDRTGQIETIGTTDLHPFWLEAAPDADPAPLCDLTTDELAGDAAYLTHNVNAPTRGGPAGERWREQWPTAHDRAPDSVPAASIPPDPCDPSIVHGTRGWVYARDLLAGYQLRSANGRTLTVLNVQTKAAPQQVYNFTVARAHSYHIGNQATWTHNTKRCRVVPTDFSGPSGQPLTSIAENTELLLLWQTAISRLAKANSPPGRRLRNYLGIMRGGRTPRDIDLINQVWDDVRGAFNRLAGDRGLRNWDDIHHWNHTKQYFSKQVLDPRNLFPVKKPVHNAIHDAVGTRGLDTPIHQSSVLRLGRRSFWTTIGQPRRLR